MSDEASLAEIAIPLDGIVRELPFLTRESLVNRVVDIARKHAAVVVGSPPATGKTSLLQQVLWYLRENNVKTHRKRLDNSQSTDTLKTWLSKKGIVEDEDDLENIEETWLLLDDAQTASGENFFTFWEYLLKGIKTSEARNKVFIVIAATYDLSTPDCPVVFAELPHAHPGFALDEAVEVVSLFSGFLQVSSWTLFFDNLFRLAMNSPQNYHIGVVMAGLRLVQDLRKAASQQDLFNEQHATSKLRSGDFLNKLQRCFGLRVRADNHGTHEHAYDIANAILHGMTEAIPTPLLRSGILNAEGQFSSLAAFWYYNRVSFPNRADEPPDSLDDLILQAVPLLSAKRLRGTLENGFPKEATFQHLFDEAISRLLPLGNFLVPEFNTFALDEKGDPAYGELDFYITGDLQWCLELLRNGEKIGEHLDRFDANIGKYREVPQKSYLAVDCRGPKARSSIVNESRCTLYFADDFLSCVCKMRLRKEETLLLSP